MRLPEKEQGERREGGGAGGGGAGGGGEWRERQLLYLWDKIKGGMKVYNVISVEGDRRKEGSEVTQAQHCATDDA